MRVRLLLLGIGLAAATAATAQTIVTQNVGFAHDCFIYAKVGADPYDGVEICNQAVKREALNKKDLAATYDNRGVMLDQLGRNDKAGEDFRMAMSLDPRLGDPYVNLGVTLIKNRQYSESLDQINKGLDLGMSFPHIGYYDRAVAEQMMGRYKEAYYDYKKVLEIEPDYAPATERLKDFTVTTIPAKVPG
jgi:tetratricopeptide (TPR) repeat protein